VLLSAASGKIGTYVLPCFPAAAVLIALGVAQTLQQRPAALRRALGSLAAACALLAAALWAERSFVQTASLTHLLRTVDWPLLAAALAGCAVAAVAAVPAPARARIWAFAACALPLLLVVPWLARVEPSPLMPQLFVGRHAQRVPAQALIAADKRCLYAAALVLTRNDLFLLHPGELGYGLRSTPAREKRLWHPDRLREALGDPERDRPIALFAEQSRYEALRASGLPAPDALHSENALVFALFEPPRKRLPVFGAGDVAGPAGNRAPDEAAHGSAVGMQARELPQRPHDEPLARDPLEEDLQPARVQ
jgi:4-amino-4-deoxy-L-arabinose transferase-like glycosyltransferase